MENQIIITTAISNCPRTGLPRVARYTNHTIHANGSVSVNYSVDTLDLQGEVFQADCEQGSVSYSSFPINNGNEVVEDVLIPEIEALVTASKTKVLNVLKTLNVVE